MLKIAQLFGIDVMELLDDYNSFMFGGQGNAVKAARIESGLNIRQLERKHGLQHGLVRKWEKELIVLTKHSWEKYYSQYQK